MALLTTNYTVFTSKDNLLQTGFDTISRLPGVLPQSNIQVLTRPDSAELQDLTGSGIHGAERQMILLLVLYPKKTCTTVCECIMHISKVAVVAVVGCTQLHLLKYRYLQNILLLSTLYYVKHLVSVSIVSKSQVTKASF